MDENKVEEEVKEEKPEDTCNHKNTYMVQAHRGYYNRCLDCNAIVEPETVAPEPLP